MNKVAKTKMAASPCCGSLLRGCMQREVFADYRPGVALKVEDVLCCEINTHNDLIPDAVLDQVGHCWCVGRDTCTVRAYFSFVWFWSLCTFLSSRP